MADLAALLDREASAEIEAILSEARQRASEIAAQGEEEAKNIEAGRERTQTAQYEAALVRARSAAQLEASALLLRAQHDAVQAVFAEAEEKLSALANDPAWPEVLQALMREAADSAGVAPAEIDRVLVNPRDRQPAAQAAEALGLTGKVHADESVVGGVRVVVGGSNLTIENTLPGRLERLRDELAADVAQVLLGKEG